MAAQYSSGAYVKSHMLQSSFGSDNFVVRASCFLIYEKAISCDVPHEPSSEIFRMEFFVR